MTEATSNHNLQARKTVAKANPFRPTSPVYPGMFAGRFEELNAIDKALVQTRHDNPMHLMFVGERGIGKTSLLQFAQLIARGETKWGDDQHNYLCVRLSLDATQSLLDFAESLSSAIEHQLASIAPEMAWFKDVWKFVKNVDIKTPAGGIAYKDARQALSKSQVVTNLIHSVVNTVKGLTGDSLASDFGLREKKDGLVLLIDEADKAAPGLDLGTFLKRLSEALNEERTNRLLIVLTGLPPLKKALVASHESSLRLFEEYLLDRLSEDEVDTAVTRALETTKESSGVEVSIDPDALKEVHKYSEGYPHFVQQLGYSMFEMDTDKHIDKDDVAKGFFADRGALERIGDRYYHKAYYEDISTEAQREVLNIMAEQLDEWVLRSDIRTSFSGKPKTLDTCIHHLRKKGIILVKEGARGQYRLQWRSFAFWIKFHNRQTHRLS